jgi:Uma2 family endonuclease
MMVVEVRAMTLATQALTIRDLAEMPDGERFELAGGELVERTLNPESTFVAGKIYRHLDQYTDTHPDWIALTDGAGFRLGDDEEPTLRKPDAALVRRSRLAGGRFPVPCFEGAPELAVEVVSPSDVIVDLESKIAEYFAAGAALVWVAKPFSRRIVVHRPDGSETSLGPDEQLTAEPLLPDFRMTVADVFPPKG